MKTKRVLSRTLIAVLAIILLGTMAPWASAQCGYFAGPKMGPSSFQPLSWQAPAKSGPGSLLLVSEDRSDGAAIVGFWKVLFVAEGNNPPGPPDGVTVDFGFQQWHSDGTEILNSGMRAPATGNFCLGVWKKTGRSRYKLNHFALSYDPAGNFVGPANIREEVVLDRDADSYSGSFAITQFDQKGNPIGGVVGRVTGTRITVDTQP